MELPAMYTVSTPPPGDYTMKKTKTENSVTDIFAVVHENNRCGSHLLWTDQWSWENIQIMSCFAYYVTGHYLGPLSIIFGVC